MLGLVLLALPGPEGAAFGKVDDAVNAARQLGRADDIVDAGRGVKAADRGMDAARAGAQAGRAGRMGDAADAAGAARRGGGWTSQRKLQEHYLKHVKGRQFGPELGGSVPHPRFTPDLPWIRSIGQYRDISQRIAGGGYLRKVGKSGNIYHYDQGRNILVITTPDGRIISMFSPAEGIGLTFPPV